MTPWPNRPGVDTAWRVLFAFPGALAPRHSRRALTCIQRTMPPQRKDICDCGNLERMADNPKCPVEFAADLNEYHIVGEEGAYWLVYYCSFCGGTMPKSRRERLFHRISEAEQHRLCELSKDMRTVQDVTAAFGEPDIYHKIGRVSTTPEREGKPEVTKSQPVMIYTKLSETADVHITVYPTDRVGIHFQGKGIKKRCGLTFRWSEWRRAGTYLQIRALAVRRHRSPSVHTPRATNDYSHQRYRERRPR